MYKIISIKKNFFYNTILSVTNVLFPLITFPYITRIFSADLTGEVTFASSVINYFIMFASLGIPTYGIRACANVRENKEKLSKLVQELIMINIIMTFISFFILIVSMQYLIRFQQIKILLYINSMSLFLNCIGINWMYSALENYRFITIRSLIIKGLSVAAIFCFVKSREDYLLYAFFSVVGMMGGNIVNLIYSRKFISFKIIGCLNLKRHLKAVFTFFATSIAVSIYTNLDVVMLGFMNSASEVGYYSAAMKIRYAAAVFVTSLGTVILPRLSYLRSINDNTFFYLIKKSMRFTWVLSVPITVFLLVFAKESLVLLSGPSFSDGVSAMYFLIPTVFIAGLSNVTGMQVLVSCNLEKKLLVSIICGAFIDFFLNLVLIPEYGSSGAAFSTLIAEIVVLFVQLSFFGKKIIRIFDGKGIFNIILSTIIALLSIKLFMGIAKYNILIKVIYNGLLYFGVYFMCLIVMRDDFVVPIIKTIFKEIRK